MSDHGVSSAPRADSRFKGVISVRGLRLRCVIGIIPSERRRPRILLVDADVEISLDSAARSGNLEETIDYRAVADILREVASARQYELVEQYCCVALSALGTRFPLALAITVRAAKKGALRGTKWAGVKSEICMRE